MRTPHGPLSRREALVRLGSVGLAAAAVVGATGAFADRQEPAPTGADVPDWRVKETGQVPRAVAARGADPASNVRRAVAALGGIERYVKRGEVVLIKPNVGWDRLPEQAANTDPRVVSEIVRQCRGAGAGRVIVADVSCNDPARCFARSGILAAAEAAGAEVLDGRKLKAVAANLGGSLAGQEVIAQLLQADRVINVPIVKHHGMSRATLGMKNWFGVLRRGRDRLHQDLDRCIAELAATFRPTLTIVDATRVLVANGPTGGSLSDVRQVGAVAAGVDPVLCDAWGAVQLGLDPRSLGFVVEAEQRRLGVADVKLVRELGKA